VLIVTLHVVKKVSGIDIFQHENIKIEQYRMNLSPKISKKNICVNCDFTCSKESEWNRHISTRKHKNRTI